MPEAPRTSLQRFIFGPLAFAQHEELLAFQHRFLIAIALGSTGFNLLLCTLFPFVAAGSDYLSIVMGYWGLFAVLNLGLWAWLRSHPRQWKTGAHCSTILYLCTWFLPAQQLPADPLQPMWALPFVMACFIMLGRWWGWFYYAICLALSLWLLRRIDLAAFPHAQLTGVLALTASAFVGHVYVERFNYLFGRLSHHNAELLRLSTYDALTGTLNAGAYYQQCNAQLALCHRMDLPFCVLFVDLDHFKHINDSYGHAMGDHVLQQAALVLRRCLRESDLLGRVGGEEFSVLLPNTPHDGGLMVAERIRSTIEAQAMGQPGQQLQVTASVGLTWSHARTPVPQAIHAIQQLADQAMYDAKRAGRNRVSSFAPPPLAPAETEPA